MGKTASAAARTSNSGSWRQSAGRARRYAAPVIASEVLASRVRARSAALEPDVAKVGVEIIERRSRLARGHVPRDTGVRVAVPDEVLAATISAVEYFDEDFRNRILVFDADAAVEYATLVVEREAAGRPISMADAQMAAVCRVHTCTLATRNVRDFEGTGATTLNPWNDTSE